MIIKRIVLLANSRKNLERCVAGKEVLPNGCGKWIRPVSLRAGGGLSETERRYVGNIEPSTLDIIDIPLVCHKPHLNHTEDWSASSRRHWIKKGTVTWNAASELVDKPETLWINGFRTFNGINDEIPLNLSQNLPNSLLFILVDALRIHVINDYYQKNKKIVASFVYKNIPYKLSVTDIGCEAMYKNFELGDYDCGECLLTISLGEPFQKNNGELCQYKLIAAIIPKPKD